MNKRIAIIFAGLVIACAGVCWMLRPCLFLAGEDGVIAVQEAYAGLPIKIRFIHSVQKTPVEEFLTVSQDISSVKLKSTIYHSFGVGLPFMIEEGNFRHEGDDFILEDMNRSFKNLSLRTGLGTKLEVTVENDLYSLYENYEPGYRIDIFIKPRLIGYISVMWQ